MFHLIRHPDFLAVGGLLADAFAAMNTFTVVPVIAMIFIVLGLFAPVVRALEDPSKETHGGITQ